MKPRHVLILAALAATSWLAFFGGKASDEGIAKPVERTGSSKASSAQRTVAASDNSNSGDRRTDGSTSLKRKDKPEIAILALRDRTELIGGASSGSDAGLFGAQSWAPPPPPPAKPGPPPPPTAPAMPFTFLGMKHEDAVWEVYLAKGDTTLIVHEQSVIEGTYRVDSIKPPALTLTYLPMNQKQTLTIGEAD